MGVEVLWFEASFHHMMGPLILCPDRVNSDQYINILKEGIINYFNQLNIEENNLIFMQDKAPCHTSKKTFN